MVLFARVSFATLFLAAFVSGPCAFGSDLAQSTGDLVPELIQAKALRKIPDLVWEATPVSVSVAPDPEGSGKIGLVRFRGRVPSLKGGNVIYMVDGFRSSAPVSEVDGAIEIAVPIRSSRVRISLRAIDDFGRAYDDAIEVDSVYAKDFVGNDLNYDVGVGLTSIDYRETIGTTKFAVRELGVTPKAGANLRLAPEWELGGNFFFTAVPIRLSASPESLYLSRWYGVNARIGRTLARPSALASFHLLIGYYVWGMLTPETDPARSYGVKSLGGPQAFLIGRFRTRSRRAYAAYLKYASIQDRFRFSSACREFALGANYQITRFGGEGRRWMLSLDYADIRYRNGAQEFALSTLTLGIGTAF